VLVGGGKTIIEAGDSSVNPTLELSELDSKIGQLFMVGIPGPGLDEGTEALIRDCNLGGVILFSRNIKDPLQLATLCHDLQEKAMTYHGRPLILAVDQEGGRVARLKEPFTVFPGNSAVGANDHPVEKAIEFGRVTANEMKLVGLNMNLAPVVDVQRGEPEKHLAGRSFGEDPDKVALLGRTVVRSLQENGIMAVAKHFPGLGRTTVDPHFQLPRIEIGQEEIERINLPPFQAAIDEGVSSVMTSHAIYPAFDSKNPATLSPLILLNLLREKMAFDGLLITDDLEMGAIAKHWSVAEAAHRAFQAGADILLICKEHGNALESIRLLRGSLLRGEIKAERLDQSIQRIEKAKSRFLAPMEEISIARVKEYFRMSA
jgi:beta-N-acetylhexosaminidase